MEKITLCNDSIARKRQKQKRILIAFVAICLLLMLPLTPLGAILVFVVLYNLFLRDYGQVKCIAEGEEALWEIASYLPDDYRALQNWHADTADGDVRADLVVVGPNGVTVVHKTDRSGTFTGNCRDTRWTQNKIGRRGTPYSSTFPNPIRQMRWQVNAVETLLNGSEPVRGALFFSSAQAVIQLSRLESTAPLFAAGFNGYNELFSYLQSGPAVLSPQQTDDVFNRLYAFAKSPASHD